MLCNFLDNRSVVNHLICFHFNVVSYINVTGIYIREPSYYLWLGGAEDGGGERKWIEFKIVDTSRRGANIF